MRLTLGFSLLSLALTGWKCAHADEAPLTLKKDLELRGSQVAGDAGPLFLSADTVRSLSADVVEASGEVEARKAGQNFYADTLRYDRGLNQIEAIGNVRLEQPKIVIVGSTLKLQLDTHTGLLTDPRYRILPAPEVRFPGRGGAKSLEFAGENKYAIEDATYTTCPIGNDDWYLKVGNLEIDQDKQIGTARNVLLTFKDMPLLYTPWADFSLNDARKSGFLPPTIGGSGKSGLDLTVPYYFNLAPNYDATLYPRWMATRGLQVGGEFRYLMPSYRGEAALEYLPEDEAARRTRWLTGLIHQQQFSPRLKGQINFLRVSDNEYFRDLSNRVSVTSRSILPHEGSLSYSGDGWQAGLGLQQLQVLQDPNAPSNPQPYNRLPYLTLLANRELPSGIKASLDSEYTFFRHPTLVEGNRLTLYPSVAMPFSTSAVSVVPKLGYHFTHYRLEGDPAFPKQNTRALPIASVDSTLFLERDFSFRGNAYLQTLEPRAYYVYAPFRDQSDLPAFDSALLDLNFSQLFTENQFTGRDRINDANQLTLALTSRFIDDATGLERLRVAFGQRYYFSSQKVTLPGTLPRDRNSTDLLALVSGQISNAWRLDSGWQYDTDLGQTIKSTISASYRPAPGHNVSMGYRFTKGSIEQLDSAFQWPLTKRLYGLARANYSLRDSRLTEGLAGLEYNGGCWVVRGVVQRIATGERDVSNSYYLQLELNGMGRLGASPMDALKESIPGYTPTNEFPNP